MEMMDVDHIRRRRNDRLAADAVSRSSSSNVATAMRSTGPIGDAQQVERSSETEGNPFESIIPSEFECILCLRLYYEPVSLPCGHTYCRGCLKQALATKPQCPMCRAACHVTAGGSGTNQVMVEIITTRFPAEYAARGKEAEQDAIAEAETRRRAAAIGESVTPAPDGSVAMPVCLLDVLLFPHQPVTLYLFEPRYITLVNRCLSDTRRFAVFSESSPAAGAAGAILEIIDARMVGGGQYLVMCRGVGRCISVGEFEIEAGTSGLRYARVSPFEDEEEAEGDVAAASNGGGAGAGRTQPRTADEVLGVELRELADRTAAVVTSFISKMSTRQRMELVRRCGEFPKLGNASLSTYRKMSFWLPSALALSSSASTSDASGGNGRSGVRDLWSTTRGATLGARSGRGDATARDRRVAMFKCRSLKQRLTEACEAVMVSEAVRGSTVRRRERGFRRLFCSPGNGGGRSPVMLSSTMNSVLLVVGILAALWAYQRYSRA